MRPKTKHEIKIEKKYEKLLQIAKETVSDLRKINRGQKKRIKELEKSRDNCKVKLKASKGVEKNLKAKLERRGKAKGHHYDINLVALCVQLRILAGCSYGSICKIIVVLNKELSLNLLRCPCPNTIQNWVSKVGLYELKKASLSSIEKDTKREVTLIIDESIRLGKEKLLLVLMVPYEKIKSMALGFEDVSVLYMEGSTRWTGPRISKALKRVMKGSNIIVKNILCDEDNKLKKTCRLLKLTHLPDISHAMATCIKQTFEKDADYKGFTSLITSFKRRGNNQDLSYLCPPKQRTKARFMNIEKVVKWAEKMIEKIPLLCEKELAFFKELEDHKKLIGSLGACIKLVKEVSLPLKKDGLSKANLLKAREAIKKVDKRKKYTKVFIKNVEKYLDLYASIIAQGPEEQKESRIHVSSEVIESMFGKYKNKASNNNLAGVTKLNLEIPLYGLKSEELSERVTLALEGYSSADINEWITTHSSESQLIKRNKFFKNVA